MLYFGPLLFEVSLPGWLVLLWLDIISTIAVRDLIVMVTVHGVVLTVPPLLFIAKRAALRTKSNDGLARNRVNVSEE
jgi:hypothetical protein